MLVTQILELIMKKRKWGKQGHVIPPVTHPSTVKTVIIENLARALELPLLVRSVVFLRLNRGLRRIFSLYFLLSPGEGILDVIAASFLIILVFTVQWCRQF